MVSYETLEPYANHRPGSIPGARNFGQDDSRSTYITTLRIVAVYRSGDDNPIEGARDVVIEGIDMPFRIQSEGPETTSTAGFGSLEGTVFRRVYTATPENGATLPPSQVSDSLIGRRVERA